VSRRIGEHYRLARWTPPMLDLSRSNRKNARCHSKHLASFKALTLTPRSFGKMRRWKRRVDVNRAASTPESGSPGDNPAPPVSGTPLSKSPRSTAYCFQDDRTIQVHSVVRAIVRSMERYQKLSTHCQRLKATDRKLAPTIARRCCSSHRQ
jgi:hypothetical protein